MVNFKIFLSTYFHFSLFIICIYIYWIKYCHAIYILESNIYIYCMTLCGSDKGKLTFIKLFYLLLEFIFYQYSFYFMQIKYFYLYIFLYFMRIKIYNWIMRLTLQRCNNK